MRCEYLKWYSHDGANVPLCSLMITPLGMYDYSECYTNYDKREDCSICRDANNNEWEAVLNEESTI